ncbi:MAG: helix-turn-helix domain-containing protein [Actinomycetota bacterium]
MSENSMGAYLRDARRRRRVSIDRAAEQTRIRPDYLMRMESDEFDFLAPAYVRGFLRTYARFLRVNEDPLIQEFDRKYGRGKADTSTITALNDRARRVPRQRRPLNSWTVAALLAAFALVALAVVGVINTPEPARENVAGQDEPEAPATSDEEATNEEPRESPSPDPTETEPEEEEATLALEDGLQVQLVAKRARCWIEVTADGELVTPGGVTLELGDRSETFTAEESMEIILGYAEGVNLIVNGRNLGAPGGPDAIVVSLPEDVQDLF